MSILTVENLSHGFGNRAIFEDVSFRLLNRDLYQSPSRLERVHPSQ